MVVGLLRLRISLSIRNRMESILKSMESLLILYPILSLSQFTFEERDVELDNIVLVLFLSYLFNRELNPEDLHLVIGLLLTISDCFL